MQIDHINRIKDDNRISNLREATNAENLQNQTKASANNSSGLLGVSWCNLYNKWVSKIMLNGKSIFIGYFF